MIQCFWHNCLNFIIKTINKNKATEFIKKKKIKNNNIFYVLTMWLQLETCPDLITDKGTGLWGMGT